MDKPLIELNNISKSFERPRNSIFDKKTYVKACDNVSLKLYTGQIMGIVGESGSGKSTLGQIIVRLLKEDDGQVIYNGTDISALKGNQFKFIRKDIQMIFQNSYASLNPSKKIGWLLNESMDINASFSKAEKQVKVDEIMDMVGLRTVLKGRYPHELSGGERQRTGIGLALMQNPKVIIADEAVSALDVSVSAQILNLMMELKEMLHLSYIFISHDLNVVHYLSDMIAVMQNGCIVEYGKAEDVFNNPVSDYTKLLLG